VQQGRAKPLARAADALAVNAETISRRGSTPFTQLFRDDASQSRNWNFRTQAEQMPSESGGAIRVQNSSSIR
jgi:hypothetical protein